MPPLFVASAPVACVQARHEKRKRVATWHDESDVPERSSECSKDSTEVPVDISPQIADIDGGSLLDIPATESKHKSQHDKCMNLPSIEIAVGDTVWTIRSMYERQGEDIRVGEGWQGKVLRFDDDGDALVDFLHGTVRRWIRMKHFDRLRVQGGASSGRTSPFKKLPPPSERARNDGILKVRPKFPTLLVDHDFTPLVSKVGGPLSPIVESPRCAQRDFPLLEASRRASSFTLVQVEG